MTFGEKVQKLRRGKGFSQEELAEMLAVTRQTISKWELSQSTPELEYIAKLSDIYGVTTDYLIKENCETETVEEDIQVNDPTEFVQGTVAMQKVRLSPLFLFGLVVAVIGMLGICAFVIASAIHPMIYATTQEDYDGVMGYLLCTDTLDYFTGLEVMVILGILTAIIGMAQQHIIRMIKLIRASVGRYHEK